MTLAHIVAAAENDVIGVEGGLPWNLPEDMKFFRDKTRGHAIIMGRKTYECVEHPLPDRLNVVVTRRPDYKAEGAHVVSSIEEGIEYCKQFTDKYGDEIFIIGGGEIYKQSMDIVDIIYLTRVHKDYPGDAKYPKVDSEKFEVIEKRERTEPEPFTFFTYSRKSD